jgi:hypothetical protein
MFSVTRRFPVTGARHRSSVTAEPQPRTRGDGHLGAQGLPLTGAFRGKWPRFQWGTSILKARTLRPLRLLWWRNLKANGRLAGGVGGTCNLVSRQRESCTTHFDADIIASFPRWLSSGALLSLKAAETKGGRHCSPLGGCGKR